MAEPRDVSSASSFADLLAAASSGDAAAWQALVTKVERVVWKAVNMMTTDNELRKDAFAATWLRLVERLDTIREPEKLPGWLATTATNEVRQILRNRNQQNVPVDFGAPEHELGARLSQAGAAEGDHERNVVADEMRRVVREAFATLDEDCREIITVLVLADPPVPYKEASERLNRPIGALGPSRRRCLEKMRDVPGLSSWAR